MASWLQKWFRVSSKRETEGLWVTNHAFRSWSLNAQCLHQPVAPSQRSFQKLLRPVGAKPNHHPWQSCVRGALVKLHAVVFESGVRAADSVNPMKSDAFRVTAGLEHNRQSAGPHECVLQCVRSLLQTTCAGLAPAEL